MLQIGICEDIVGELERQREMVKKIMHQLSMNAEIRCFVSGENLLIDVENKGQMDIILMDIEMNGMNGVETARVIRKTDFRTILIFISSYDQYCKEMISVQPFAFIDKPVSVCELKTVLEHALEVLGDNNEVYEFVNKKVRYSIFLTKIRYFESDKRVIHIYGIDEVYSFYDKLDEVEKNLSSSRTQFLRVHKSYLLNTSYIKEFRYDKIVMDNGKVIGISEKYRELVKHFYLERVRLG